VYFEPRLALAFVAVAREASFTRAAIRMGISQPSVSEQLRKLEDQLGFRLLARTSRTVELTTYGEAFLPHAKAIAEAFGAASAAVAEMRGHARGVLKVGNLDILSEWDERRALITASPTTILACSWKCRLQTAWSYSRAPATDQPWSS
jgi:DNA-binding transcriptional LysR family regulator